MHLRNVNMRKSWGTAVPCAVVMLILPACGSTVQWSETTAAGADGVSRDQLSLSSPEGHGNGARDDAKALGSSTASLLPDDSPSSQTPRDSTTSRLRRNASSLTLPPPGMTGKGFTTDEIYIGYATFKALEGAGSSIGIDVGLGDQEAQAKAIVRDINARGGVAGRRLVPVFYDVKTEEVIRSPDEVAQKACTRWTEDRPVFAVVNLITAIGDNTLAACLTKRHTPLVHVGLVVRPRSIYVRYSGILYAPPQPSMERLVPTWVRRAAARDYFQNWDSINGRAGTADIRVGILSVRTAYGNEFRHLMQQELTRNGQNVAATYEISGRFDTMSNEMNQAVVRFREAGVTHVVPQFVSLFYFATSAEAQNYRPRYMVASDNALQTVQSNSASEQMSGAIGVGHMPVTDVDNIRDPGDVSPAQKRCRRVMQDAGQSTSERGAYLFMVQACDGFNFLTKAIDRGGLSTKGIKQGSQSLGLMNPASTFAISFPGGRQDGAAAARDIGYRLDCRCFTYLSKTNQGM